MSRFHEDFIQALFDPSVTSGLAAQPGFAVYRNTVMNAGVEALEANFPTLRQLVGEEWFRAAARIYVRESPPAEASLMRYGDGLAAFLQRFEPAADMPWLADVARADWHWLQCLFAADDPVLPADEFASLAPEQLPAIRLRPNASARWLWFERGPAADLWIRHQRARDSGLAPELDTLDWQTQGLLLTREDGVVRGWPLPAAGFVFLQACEQGLPLAEVIGRTLGAEPSADLSSLIRLLLQTGALASLSRGDSSDPASAGLSEPQESL